MSTTVWSPHADIVTVKGHDSFGPWTMVTSEDGIARCPLCDHGTTSILAYYQLKLPMGINVASTILKRVRQPIGVGCGCWSRFTRQVVHIAEAGLRKGYPV